MPSLSIITVCHNSALTLNRTVRSILDQNITRKEWEYIIIDGASTDGTVEIIKEWAERGIVTKWISEPDEGIYDAMNKGLRMATGDYICMLNSDDELTEGALRKILNASNSCPPYIYGNNYIVGDRIYTHKYPVGAIMTGVFCCHQALWIRNDIYGKVGCYRTDVGMSADYEFMIRLQDLVGEGKYINDCLCFFYDGGVSSHYTKTMPSCLQITEIHIETLAKFARLNRCHATRFLLIWSGILLESLARPSLELEYRSLEKRWIELTGQRIGPQCRLPFYYRILFTISLKAYLVGKEWSNQHILRIFVFPIHFLCKISIRMNFFSAPATGSE